MKTLRPGSKDEEVLTLQNALIEKGHSIKASGEFDMETEKAVRDFQKQNGLGCDGIAGRQTWEALLSKPGPLGLTEDDYLKAAAVLDVDIAAIKAVKEVETGGLGGFLQPGRPVILFEGHIFWQQLRKLGHDPSCHVEGNEDILYQKWTRAFYKGGIREYDRLEKAEKICREAAHLSASWGMFQIMGFNHKVCGCENVSGFVERMCADEYGQLELFIEFVRSNKLDGYLRTHNWKEFARHYNGPEYEQNRYDTKLEAAYKRHSAG